MIQRFKSMRHKFLKIFALVFFVSTILTVLVYYFNHIDFTRITFNSTKLPRQYSGYKIVHIANIDNQDVNIVKKIKKESPDIVVISGGFTDSEDRTDKSIKLINEISKYTEVYCVFQSGDMSKISQILDSISGNSIDNRAVEVESDKLTVEQYIKQMYPKELVKEFEKDDSEIKKEFYSFLQSKLSNDANNKINIMGLSYSEESTEELKDKIYSNINLDDDFNILISGDINFSTQVKNTGIDLVLSSGTYGDKSYIYNRGAYNIDNYTLIVNSGCCTYTPNGRRLLAYPEVQVITLRNPAIQEYGLMEKMTKAIDSAKESIYYLDSEFEEFYKLKNVIKEN